MGRQPAAADRPPGARAGDSLIKRAELIRILRAAGRPLKPSEVAPRVGKELNAVKVLLWKMNRDGQAGKTDNGAYFPLE